MAKKRLRLRAEDEEDVTALSAFMQDALVLPSDIVAEPARRRFTLLAKRYCWEDETKNRLFRPRPRRVQSALRFDFVDHVQERGVRSGDLPLNLLSIAVEASDAADSDQIKRVQLLFSQNAALLLRCESIDITLDDVSEPWTVASRPKHD